MCEAGDFGEGRPSEYPSLRAKGHKQYWYTRTKHTDVVGKKEERGVVISADLTAEQAEEVRESISSCSNPAPSQRKRTAPALAPRTQAAKKRRKDAATGKASQMRKLKSLIDKTSTELKTLASQVPSLSAKSYPQQMVDWALGQINPLQVDIDQAQEEYAAVATQVRGADAGVEELESDVAKCIKAHTALQAKHSEWLKGVAAEVKKLLG